MKTSKLGALVLIVIAFAIAQVALAQSGGPNGSQSGTPQPTTQNSNSVAVVRPKPSRQQTQQQARYLQSHQHQEKQTQQPPLPPQQLRQQAQPQEQPQQSAAIEQDQPQQQAELRHQRRARTVHQSHPVPASVMNYATALQKCQKERHPRVWWAAHYPVIVYSVGGYYYFDSGYWFPAFGYAANYEAYDYDGPIYTYGNLLPDQVILNVQRALTDLGYYDGPLTGSLSARTRYAISAYQEDNGLVVNGIVDAPLVYSLGLQ